MVVMNIFHKWRAFFWITFVQDGRTIGRIYGNPRLFYKFGNLTGGAYRNIVSNYRNKNFINLSINYFRKTIVIEKKY